MGTADFSGTEELQGTIVLVRRGGRVCVGGTMCEGWLLAGEGWMCAGWGCVTGE